MARSNDDPKAPPSHPAQNGFAGKRHFPGNFCPKAASLKGYSVTHGDEREIGVLHDVNVLTEKVLLVWSYFPPFNRANQELEYVPNRSNVKAEQRVRRGATNMLFLLFVLPYHPIAYW